MTKSFNKNILFVGNYEKEKGFICAIEALKKLPEFDIYLVGTCYKKIPKKQRENVHVECVVPSLRKYFKSCTYYLHPADFDPSPVTVWKAINAGLIPIITNAVGQSELFKGKVAKLVLENNKPETIAGKIREIDNLPISKKKELVRICKKLASKYTKEKSVKEFRLKFSELIKRV